MSFQSPPRRDLRMQLLAARDGSSSEQRREWDVQIREHLFGLCQELAGDPATLAVGAYHPLGSEPDLRPLYGRFGEVALPKVVSSDAPLTFLRYVSGMELVAQGFGVLVPKEEIAAHPTVLFIPCVGFHVDGRGRVDRLGYGGGFYDRTLAARHFVTIGIAYEASRIEAFAPHAHDRALDYVVTESGVMKGAPAD